MAINYSLYQGRGRDKASMALRPIEYLPNESGWVDHVYCVQAEDDQFSGDQVLGGVLGIANAPHQALANRTYFLKDQLVKLATIVSVMQEVLGDQLNSIKSLRVSKTESVNYEHEAWLGIDQPKDIPEVILTFENNTYVRQPVFEVTLENGRVYHIRTDGTSVIVPTIDEYLDPTVWD